MCLSIKDIFVPKVAQYAIWMRVLVGWVKTKKPVKPIQKNLKKWIEFGHLVDMVLKNKKFIKYNGFWIKPDPNLINSLTQ